MKPITPYFSEFRQLMDLWDEQISKEKQAQIKEMLDGNSLAFFFVINGTIFGTTEDDRLVFARMKNPDEETPENWGKEATFSAYNLDAALKNEKVRSMFGFDDLEKLEVIDSDKAYALLAKKAEKKVGSEKNIKTVLDRSDEEGDDGIPSNMGSIGEK